MRPKVLGDALPTSSADGEQPKFLADRRPEDLLPVPVGTSCPVLVKFTAPLASGDGPRRWADLLVAEALAHRILREAGLAAPASRVLDLGGRRFLEFERFDVTALGGRRWMCSLAALDGAYIRAADRDWTTSVTGLTALGLVSADDVARVRLAQAFGHWIANSDMHFGNLAFFLTDQLPLALCPFYDMLPMTFKPSDSGEVRAQPYVAPLPNRALADVGEPARALALRYWQELADTGPELTDDFRRLAAGVARAVASGR